MVESIYKMNHMTKCELCSGSPDICQFCQIGIEESIKEYQYENTEEIKESKQTESNNRGS